MALLIVLPVSGASLSCTWQAMKSLQLDDQLDHEKAVELIRSLADR
jgi:hypothetical protein